MMFGAMGQVLPSETCYWKDVWQRLHNMRQLWQLCDVSLFSEDGKCFKAHSIILAASSSVFHVHFLNGGSTFISEILPSELHLSGISSDVLQVTLDFIYGVVPESIINFKRLQKGADRLGIAAATAFCRQQLNELEELAKGNKVTSDKPSEILPVTPKENVDPKRKQNNNKDRVNFPKCPYLTNMTAESSHIVPLKKRFLLKVLSQLKNEEVPLSSVVSGSGKDSSYNGKDDKEASKNNNIVNHERPSLEISPTQCDESTKMSTVPTVQTSFLNSPLSSQSMSSLHHSEAASEIRHSIASPVARSSDHFPVRSFAKADDRYDSIPHHVPHLDFNDMGIQCPHLQKLVGPVDSYSGFPMDVIESLEDTPLDSNSKKGQGHIKQKVFDAVNKTKENSSTISLDESSSSLCQLAPEVIPTSTLDGQLGQASAWPVKDCEMSSITRTVNSCPVSKQTAQLTSKEESQTRCKGELIKLEIINVPHSGTGAFYSHEQDQDFELNPVQVELENMDAVESYSSSNNLQSHIALKDQMKSPQMMDHGRSLNVFPMSATYQEQGTSNHHENSQIESSKLSIASSTEDYPLQEAAHLKTIPGVECFSPSIGSRQKLSAYHVGSPSWDVPSNVPSRKSQVKTFISSTSQQGLFSNLSQDRQPEPSGKMFYETITDAEEYCEDRNKPGNSPSESDSETSDNTDPDLSLSPESKMDNATILEMLETSYVEDKKQFKCVLSGCDYSNKNIEYVQSHLYHRHGHGSPHIKCADCHRKYFSESQLKTHKKQTHESGGAKCRLLTCEDCEEKCKNSQALLMHRLKAHGKGKLFSCGDCAFKSPRKKDLQGHMISQHGKAPLGVRVYQCELCEYKCIDRNRFSEHEASHTQQRSFQCDHCGNYYATRRGLRNHLKYHSNERPHKCTICNAAFKVRAKLRDHIRLLHLNKGEKPYKCGYCEFQAAVRGNVNQHIRNTHKGQQIVVTDLKSEERKHVKDYDYANMAGAQIREVKDASAAGYASVGRV